jgi:hypothetical protein
MKQRKAALEFKGPVEGYVVNYVTRNGWKVASSQTRDDLMQDAYIVYARVIAKYPAVSDAPHLMSLFKTAWHRHFLDLAKADTQARAVLAPLVSRDEDGREVDLDPVGATDNDGCLAVMVRQAPREVGAVLNLFMSAPQELLELALSSWQGPDKRTKARGCEKINRLLGLPPHLDSLQAVHDYFH